MKRLWRIGNHCDLNGLGGEKADGRWHTASRGKRIVYLSEHPAVALIESLVNLKGNPALFPGKYQLLDIEVEDAVLDSAARLVGKENESPSLAERLDETQSHGDSWLKEGISALAAVPSLPSPFSLNYLFNPLHPDANKVRLGNCRWLEYGERLFRIRS